MNDLIYLVHTDGGSRGNPGPAAIGVVIEKQRSDGAIIPVHSFGKSIGVTTNNVAEYTAVIEALIWLGNHLESGAAEAQKLMNVRILFYLDSALVVNQLNGLFKVKDEKMRMLMLKVRSQEQGLGGVIKYEAVPRALNASADFQVNAALDGNY